MKLKIVVTIQFPTKAEKTLVVNEGIFILNLKKNENHCKEYTNNHTISSLTMLKKQIDN